VSQVSLWQGRRVLAAGSSAVPGSRRSKDLGPPAPVGLKTSAQSISGAQLLEWRFPNVEPALLMRFGVGLLRRLRPYRRMEAKPFKGPKTSARPRRIVVP
jgi:hypothetical protein